LIKLACSCQGNQNNRFRVVVSGKVVYTTTSEASASQVAARYEGATIKKPGEA
jgi:hypothetical protein